MPTTRMFDVELVQGKGPADATILASKVVQDNGNRDRKEEDLPQFHLGSHVENITKLAAMFRKYEAV